MGKVYMYKICFKNHIYVGCTNNLKKRQRDHRYECFNMFRSNFQTKKYRTLRDCGITREEIKCELLEVYEDITKQESSMIEGNWILALNADLNTLIPGRSRREALRLNQLIPV